ncbi:MAG: hypothetical protein JO280_05200 [Mycobacteriaceae bacterium]|nr:hypothetical protein [Mycobacteriaceae bacterium]
MRMKTPYITVLFAAGAAAAAIASSPMGTADSTTVQPSCISLGASQTQCQTPGNVQIDDNPAYLQGASPYPYWQNDSSQHDRFRNRGMA